MKVLLTNDDGIQATGLHAMRRALLDVPGVELAVIAPDSNRSATARSITTRSPLWVDEFEFGDGTTGHATDGTPVDPAHAKTIIAEQWTVPPEVRARRRSRKPTSPSSKAGKAPQQVHAGHDRSDTRRVDKRGDLPRDTSVLAARTPVKATT